VFISNAVHKIIQEFLTKHRIGVTARVAAMIGIEDIFLSLSDTKLQVWSIHVRRPALQQCIF